MKILTIIKISIFIIPIFLFSSANDTFAESLWEKGLLKNSENFECQEGFVLLKQYEVCVHYSVLGNLDELMHEILLKRDAAYRNNFEKLTELENRRKIYSSSANEPTYGGRVVPLPTDGYLFSRDGGYVACIGNYESWQTAERNICAGGHYDSWQTRDDNIACGGQYDSWQTRGENICAGGLYESWQTRGDNIACGGQYDSWQTRGENICAGGLFDSWQVRGDNIACGGQYEGWQDSRDGKKVCVGGKFNGCVHSKDGKHVACGGWAHIYKPN